MGGPPFERALPVREAERRARAALRRLGLRPELTEVGGGDPTAWWCRVFGADGAPAAQGMGKGRRREARAGALFEALEHYLTGPASFDPAAVETVTPAEIASGPLRDDPGTVPLAEMPGGRPACHRYRPVNGGADLLVPLYLYTPWYVETGAAEARERAMDTCDYHHLMRYSCDSGSAVGVTSAEALLHALNEVIERDALSLLLVRAFLRPDGPPPTVIDPATLPGGPRRAHAAAGEVTGSPVSLLDVTSDLGVPTMLAYTAPTSRHPHRRGAGTSLSPAHAAWRALTELVQATLGEALAPPSRRGEPAWPGAHPDLRACGRFDLTGALDRAVTQPFTPAAWVPVHPRDQLREVVARLSARGYAPHRRRVAALPGEIRAVHVVVPGLERFMLITDGNLVLPGPRGRAAAGAPCAAREAHRNGD